MRPALHNISAPEPAHPTAPPPPCDSSILILKCACVLEPPPLPHTLTSFVLVCFQATKDFFAPFFLALNTCGWRYLALVMIVYGFAQGVGYSWASATEANLFTYPAKWGGHDLSQTLQGAIAPFIDLPWGFKPLYGMCSDKWAILGYHRRSYMVLSATISIVVFSVLALYPEAPWQMDAILILVGLWSFAIPDIMVDAVNSEHAKRNPKLGVALNSIAQSSMFLVRFLAPLKGFLFRIVRPFGVRWIFLVGVIASIGYLIPVALGWMAEEKHRGNTCCGLISSAQRREGAPSDTHSTRLIVLSLIVAGLSGLMAIVGISVKNQITVGILILIVDPLLVGSIWICLRGVSRPLALLAIWLFLKGALTPSTKVLSNWQNDEPHNCNGLYGDRPCFDPQTISNASLIVAMVGLLGTMLFCRFGCVYSYRKILVGVSLFSLALRSLDLLWVNRWNVTLGFSDLLFMYSDGIMRNVIGPWYMQAIFSMVACCIPDGHEAGLYALCMGLINLGRSLGWYPGNVLLYILGGVEEPHFHNITLLIAIQCICDFLPILLIPFMVPRGTPATGPVVENAENSVSPNDEV